MRMLNFPYSRRITEWLLDHRILVIGFVCLVTLLFAYQLRNPNILLQGYEHGAMEDKSGEEFKEFTKMFGEGELLMVVVQTDDVFTPEVLNYVTTLTRGIGLVPGVIRVDSLTTVKEIDARDGPISTRLLFSEIPTDPQVLKGKKQIALANPFCAGNLVSLDSTVTVLNVFLPPLIRGTSDSAEIIEGIEGVLEFGKPGSAEVFLTGISPMFVDSMRYANQDFKRFFWLTWVLMATILFLVFRTIRGVLLPLGTTFLAVFWTLGLMALAGQTITAVGAMLPTLIGVVCFSDAVHIMTHYYENIKVADNKRQILLDTMEHMIPACFLTTVTTIGAFASLLVADLATIREFGFWAATGIMVGYLLIIMLMPIILNWLSLPPKSVQHRYEHSLVGRILVAIGDIAVSRRWWVPLTTIILLVFSLVAILNLRVETSLATFLPGSAPSVQGLNIAQEKVTGFGSVEIVLEGAPGSFAEPWALMELQEIESYLETRSEVSKAFAITDLLQWAHGVVEQTDSDLLTDHYARGLVAEYLFMFTGADDSKMLESFLTKDHATARIGARLRINGAGEQLGLIDDIEQFIDQHLDKRLAYHLTGEADRLSRQIDSVVRSLLDSFAFTVLVISLLMLVVLGSLKKTLLAMISNMTPILLTLAVMGAMGITLNFATVMIASIAIGIAVDDTIHFFVRYNRELRFDSDQVAAIRKTISNSGRGMMFSSMAMASGFALFILSDFTTSRNFGFLLSFAMLTALLTDLFLLPYLIRAWKL